ncbi:hypothetical protein CE91St17_23350 [Alistipes onderdonkii]|nr:hypothetical protein CE91St18_27900 [Alistipes onderdonkii]GKG97273.1 hypothetical protein CE91St17_23350 [Alistipes onderdonkii]
MCRRCHGAVNKSEHSNYSAHDIVDAEIFDSQNIQYHSASVETYRHGEKHPEVEQKRILGYSFIIWGDFLHFGPNATSVK